jgi:hypothetical protein
MKARLVAAALALATTPAIAQEIVVREIGSFHIGGSVATVSGLEPREITFSPGSPPFRYDPNGDFQAGQMYVQYVRLANPRARYPLLLMHGGA